MPSEHLRKPTLSRSLSFSLSSDLLRPSSSRSIRRIVSPERVLNFFLQEKEKMIRICCKHRKLKRYNFPCLEKCSSVWNDKTFLSDAFFVFHLWHCSRGYWPYKDRKGEGGKGNHRAARRGANNHDRNKWLFLRKKENSDTLKEEIQICRAIKQFDNY